MPENATQKEVLTSYNVKNKSLAVIPFLPLQKIKPVPKLTGTIDIKAGKEVKLGDVVSIAITIKNIGKGVQKDDSKKNEFELVIPDNVVIRKGSLNVNSGHVEEKGGRIIWKGTIQPGTAISIRFDVKAKRDIHNGSKNEF